MSDRPEEEDAPQRVIVRDKRRIDPETGELRDPATVAERDIPATPPVSGPAGESARAEDLLAEELLADLQRVKAEFDNYRKRVERDRLAVVEQAAARVVAELLPVLDDIDRARAHGEVEGAFKSIADSLETTLERLGLQRFGVAGDPFDPTIHEAVQHMTSPDVTGPTCVEVLRAGYLFAERQLRPAMVAVADAPADHVQPESEQS